MRISVRIEGPVINRSIEDVFEFISEMENSPLWGRAAKTTKESDGPVSVGTVFLELAEDDDQQLTKRTEVIEFDPPTRFSYLSRYENGMTELARVTFETVRDGTRVSPEAEVEIPGVPQEQAPTFSQEMKSAVSGLLENLKDVLESPDRPVA
jgi:uncharacterized protein YndB with AHSA1/START domain